MQEIMSSTLNQANNTDDSTPEVVAPERKKLKIGPLAFDKRQDKGEKENADVEMEQEADITPATQSGVSNEDVTVGGSGNEAMMTEKKSSEIVVASSSKNVKSSKRIQWDANVVASSSTSVMSSKERQWDGFLWSKSEAWIRRSVNMEMKRLMDEGKDLLYGWDDYIKGVRAHPMEKREFMDKLYKLAKDCKVTSGKWMISAPASLFNVLWDDICEANEKKGVLGGFCKGGMENEKTKQHLICIYCPDFTNVADCRRVLYNLHDICQPFDVSITGNFKCDFLGHLGLYRGTAMPYSIDRMRLTKVWKEPNLKRVMEEYKRDVQDRKLAIMLQLKQALTEKKELLKQASALNEPFTEKEIATVGEASTKKETPTGEEASMKKEAPTEKEVSAGKERQPENKVPPDIKKE